MFVFSMSSLKMYCRNMTKLIFFSLSLSLSLSLSISLSAIHLMSRLITYGCEEMGGERQKVQGGRVSERENIGVDRAWRIENGTVHG